MVKMDQVFFFFKEIQKGEIDFSLQENIFNV